jgi:hypothetical protein
VLSSGFVEGKRLGMLDMLKHASFKQKEQGREFPTSILSETWGATIRQKKRKGKSRTSQEEGSDL